MDKMKVNVYDLQGQVKENVNLPALFEEEYRPDLIRRAGLALRSMLFQAKGTYIRAGLNTSAKFFGRRHAYRSMNCTAMTKTPRIKEPNGRMGAARRVPYAVKGRRAHPPKTQKVLIECINKKEKIKATKSAIAATTNETLAKKRGHKFDIKLPIIIIDDFDAKKKTKEIIDILEKLKLGADLERASIKSIRAGRGTTRGRKYRRKKSVLIIVGKDNGVINAAKNIPGVDACIAKDVNVELLAPGGDAGRVTIYTMSAVKELEKRFS